MPKELGGSSGSAGVFGLLAERFDDNFAPLPSPPATAATLAPPTFTAASGKMKRCASQPAMKGMDSTALSVKSRADMTSTVDDMRLAQGAITSANIKSIVPSTTDYNSHAIRYDTSPQYRSNKILSSFQEKFQTFSGQRGTVQSGTPNAAGSGRLVSAAKDSQPHLVSDSQTAALAKSTGISAAIASYTNQRLARVPEEQSGVDKSVVGYTAGSVEKSQSAGKPGLSGVARPVDSVDGTSGHTHKLPLTKQVLGWFHGPGNKVTVSRTEMNAFSPSSF